MKYKYKNIFWFFLFLRKKSRFFLFFAKNESTKNMTTIISTPFPGENYPSIDHWCCQEECMNKVVVWKKPTIVQNLAGDDFNRGSGYIICIELLACQSQQQPSSLLALGCFIKKIFLFSNFGLLYCEQYWKIFTHTQNQLKMLKNKYSSRRLKFIVLL